MYKHIIFDFGGVFLDLGGKHSTAPEHLAKIFGTTEEEMDGIWKQSRDRLVKGLVTPRQYLALLQKMLGKKVDIDAAYDEWRSMTKTGKEQINWELVEYVKMLKKHCRLHMLSDTLGLDLPREKWFEEIDGHFDNIFRSHEQKVKKPDSEAFMNALHKIGAKPDECIFIDDHEPNVVAARKLGIMAIQFRSVGQLKDELERLGVG